MSLSAEKQASVNRDVKQSQIQDLAKLMAGNDGNLTKDVPILTNHKDYNKWWVALRSNLQEPRDNGDYWDIFLHAINDPINLMTDEELAAMPHEDYTRSITVRALYLIQLQRVVDAIRATISPELSEASRSVGNHPFCLLWWIQSRFAEGRVEEMAFMQELIQDLKLPSMPQQRVLDLNPNHREWDEWDAFDMDRVGMVIYIQLTGTEKQK